MAEYTCGYTGAQIDAHLDTVAGSNLSSTNKITRSATIVVAASDSSAAAKEQADYVCDGTNDETDIQTAVSALPSVGGTVYLCEGNYLKGVAAGISLPSNVEMRLSDAATIKLADGLNTDACVFTNADQSNGNTNIKISGGELDGNEANQTSGVQCGVIFRKVSYLTIDMKIGSFRTLDMQIAGSCSVVSRNNRMRRQSEDIDLVTIDDMSDTSTWTPYNSVTTITQDTDYKCVGDAVLDMYHTSASTTRYISYIPETPMDLRDKILRLWLRIPDESHAAGIVLRLYAISSDGYAMLEFGPSAYGDSADGFLYVDIPVGTWYEQSFPDDAWGRITSIRISHYDCPPAHVWYGGLQMYTAPQKGVVSISFDDGNIDTFTNAFPILNKYRYPAVVALIPYRCDNADYVSWEQTKMLQSFGWDIAQHSYAHTDYSTLTTPEIRADISKTTISMLRNGMYSSGDMVLPWGGVTRTSEFYNTLRKYFRFVRRTTGYTNAIPTDANYGRFIATDARLRSASLETAKERALRALKHGAWIDLYLHKVLSEGGDVTPSEFDEFCAHLYDFGVPVKTWTQIGGHAHNQSFYPAGYIAPGEVRADTGQLVAGVTNAITFAWHNPEPCDILIKKVVINIGTAGGSTGSVLNVGIADDAAGTNLGAEFFSGMDANAIALNDSMVSGDGGAQTKWVLCQDSDSITDGWIVGQILTADAGSLVGTYYIEYVGV